MKRIDIHTKATLGENEVRYNEPIDNEKIKYYIYNKIDYYLPDEYWLLIDKSFGNYWNKILGIGGDFYFDEVAEYVNNQFLTEKFLFERERIFEIVYLILNKIETDGGFLE